MGEQNPMITVYIYHNPHCAKSRQALDLLRERGIDPVVIDYLATPPTPQELRSVLKRLGLGPRNILRKSEKEYLELHLNDTTLSDDQLIDAMSQHPILIERPIIYSEKKAVLGRPPEKAVDILKDK